MHLVCRCATLLLVLALSIPAAAAPSGPIAGELGFALPDTLGRSHRLQEYRDAELVVVAFLGVDCPLAKLYGARLQALSDEFDPARVQLVGVMSNSQDTLSEIAAYKKKHGITFPVLKDQGNRVADQFGAERTPEVFLLDAQRRVRYRGRVDDQHLVGVKRDAPTREDLREAIDELLAGREVTTPRADAIGCLIGRRKELNPDSKVTYSKDVAPILAGRCVECHRAGEIGPFELTSYDEAAGWGEMMVEVIDDRRMPPWHADPKHGSFANDRSMSADEIATIKAWVDNGCPEGDPADLPEPRVYTSGWQLPREPDHVWRMSEEPYAVPADGGPSGVPYQYFSVASGFDEDAWVRAAEVQPGNREVVHHIIVYAQPPGAEHRRQWVFLTAYVPGLLFEPLPEGSAKLVPAGSKFIFEMHYTPTGSPQEDISRLGVLLADPDSISREVTTVEVGNMRFRIPPNEADHVVTATSRPLDRPVRLVSLSPHMHLRGKAFRYELVSAAGERETLLDVPAYDFNWQTRYMLTSPRDLPRGSRVHCRAVFDNSPENPANPDPTKTVRWGDQSWDEMMLGYFDVLLPLEEDRSRPVRTGMDIVGMFDASDADHSGALTKDETRGRPLVSRNFDKIDASRDGLLQLGELLTAVNQLAQ